MPECSRSNLPLICVHCLTQQALLRQDKIFFPFKVPMHSGKMALLSIHFFHYFRAFSFPLKRYLSMEYFLIKDSAGVVLNKCSVQQFTIDWN